MAASRLSGRAARARSRFCCASRTWTSLEAGLSEGVIGPFGSARFAAPAGYDAFRLETPQPAPVRLQALRGAATARSGAIAKNSRDPFVTLDLASDGKEPAKLEVTGYEGQAFSLRAVRRDAHFSFEGSGPHLVGLDIAGEGGDEIAATALFARVEKDGKTRVLASDMPRLANGRPWRGKFNLRGRTTLLFEVLDAGPVAIDAKGVKLRATIEPAFGALAPRADGKIPNRYDLAAGFYTLVLDPIGDAAGVVDVTLGTPGVAAARAGSGPGARRDFLRRAAAGTGRLISHYRQCRAGTAGRAARRRLAGQSRQGALAAVAGRRRDDFDSAALAKERQDRRPRRQGRAMSR